MSQIAIFPFRNSVQENTKSELKTSSSRQSVTRFGKGNDRACYDACLMVGWVFICIVYIFYRWPLFVYLFGFVSFLLKPYCNIELQCTRTNY